MSGTLTVKLLTSRCKTGKTIYPDFLLTRKNYVRRIDGAFEQVGGSLKLPPLVASISPQIRAEEIFELSAVERIVNSVIRRGDHECLRVDENLGILVVFDLQQNHGKALWSPVLAPRLPIAIRVWIGRFSALP